MKHAAFVDLVWTSFLMRAQDKAIFCCGNSAYRIHRCFIVVTTCWSIQLSWNFVLIDFLLVALHNNILTPVVLQIYDDSGCWCLRSRSDRSGADTSTELHHLRRQHTDLDALQRISSLDAARPSWAYNMEIFSMEAQVSRSQDAYVWHLKMMYIYRYICIYIYL